MTKKNTAKKAPTAEATVSIQVDGKELNVPTDAAMRDAGMSTLSSRIRHLEGLGVPTAGIAKIVKRSNGQHPLYQHVRNVLNTPLKSGNYAPNESGEARKAVEEKS